MNIAGEAREWFAARARAARIEQQLASERLETSDPIGLAFDFFSLVEALHGWPLPQDPLAERENENVRATWMRMRRNWVRLQS